VRGGAHEQISMRIAGAERERIDRAARLSGTTRSSFILGAALERADAVILDRVHYAWDAAAMAAFEAALADPAAPAPGAIEAQGRAPWKPA
jgi:uncharacterized protein (DUF1778 family)